MNNRKYKFARFKNKNGVEYSDWWFIAETQQDVIEHTEKFFKPAMQIGLDTNLNKSIAVINHPWFQDSTPDPNHHSHPDTEAERAIQIVTNLKYGELYPITMSASANTLFESIVEFRKKNVKKQNLYLGPEVKEFAYADGNTLFDICEIIESDTFEYPPAVRILDNVKYLQWPGGEHWYAKIGNEDIIDYKGNQKWNTRKEAEEAAEWYIKENIQRGSMGWR